MSSTNKVDDVVKELEDIIYSSEISNAEMVGVLEMLKYDLLTDIADIPQIPPVGDN